MYILASDLERKNTTICILDLEIKALSLKALKIVIKHLIIVPLPIHLSTEK